MLKNKLIECNKIYLPNQARCYECGGYFPLEELETETESEDWENSTEYEVYICPICEDGGLVEIA